MSNVSRPGRVPPAPERRGGLRSRVSPETGRLAVTAFGGWASTSGRSAITTAVSVLFLLALSSCSTAASTAEPAGAGAVQPAAAGQAVRAVAGEERSDTTRPRYTEADVRFMQNMILHHEQALEMSRLVPDRTAREDIRLLARRIERSQADEIALMKRWLEVRGEEVPGAGHVHGHAEAAAHHRHDARAAHEHHGRAPAERHGEDAGPGHGPRLMAGMLSPEQLAELARAEGAEFDRLFLELMIYHHEGALEMVAELFSSPGAGQDTEIFRFASHVDADQGAEIARMRRLLRDAG